MSEVKFTRGPWFVVTNANGVPCIVQCADHRIAAAYFNGRDDGAAPDKPTSEANAALIAAAPDLYEALNEIFTRYEAKNDMSEEEGIAWAGRAHAALAKTRGQPA